MKLLKRKGLNCLIFGLGFITGSIAFKLVNTKKQKPAGNLIITKSNEGDYLSLEILDENKLLNSSKVLVKVIKKR